MPHNLIPDTSLPGTEHTAGFFKSRIQSIDVLRGIVMVIMALDHVRDFLYKAPVGNAGSLATDPTNLETTYPGLFFTRIITHFCAPVFVLLTGTSAFLVAQRRTRGQLSSFLIKRGIWLVLVEMIIITLAWTFDPLFHFIILQVIWAIGMSMILLGIAVNLPWKVVGALGLIIVLGHNLLETPDLAAKFGGNPIGDLAYYGVFKIYNFTDTRSYIIIYSVLPWTGIMFVGYALGRLYVNGFSAVRRRKLLYLAGMSLIVLFFALRIINMYGDPAPWGEQSRGGTYTFLSFLNVTKYPPSLMFICFTLGPALLLLAFLEKIRNSFTNIMNVYGRVPMLYYILHFYFIHTFVVILFYITGHDSSQIIPKALPFFFRPEDLGFPLWGVYLTWIVLVIVLFPICRRYDRYKSTHKNWWLSYL